MDSRYPATRPIIFSSILFTTILINSFLILQILAPDHYGLKNIIQKSSINTIEFNPQPLFNPDIPTLFEWRLVNTETRGNYKVETYREFKIEYNEKGTAVKATPTDHFDYLRYWIE